MYTIRSRLIVLIFGLIVAIFAAVFVFMNVLQRNSLEHTQQVTDAIIKEYVELSWEEKAHSYAAVFADQLIRPMYTKDLEAIRDLAVVTRAKGLVDGLYVVDASGMVLSDGTMESLTLGMEYDPETMRQSPDSLLTPMPISIGDKYLGTVYMEFDYSRSLQGLSELHAATESIFNESLNQNRSQFTFLLLTALLLGLLGAYLLSRGITRPMAQLSTAIENIGNSDFPMDLPVDRSDELGALARTLRDAANYLQQTTVSRDYLEQILDSMPLAMTVVDTDGVMREGNPRFAALCHGDASFTGKRLQPTLGFPEAVYYVVMRDLRNGRDVLEREIVLHCGDRNIHSLVSAVPVTPAGSAATPAAQQNERHFLFTFLDISERKQAELKIAELNRTLERTVDERTRAYKEKALELERANVRLLEIDRLKSAFLSTVSHELRTPLTSVLGFSKLIQRDCAKTMRQAPTDDPAIRRLLTRINDNASIISEESTRLTRLINNVLDLSRIESSQTPWNDTLLDVSLLASAAVDIARGAMAVDSPVELRKELTDEPLRVCMDPDRLQQVLTNLLNNAIKFTSSGSIVLTTRSLNGHGVQIAVTDTGKGIQQEELTQIFNRFYQSSGDILRDKPQGSGLGLAICKEIVAHYGGEISVESAPGQGSTFTVTLPGATPDCN